MVPYRGDEHDIRYIRVMGDLGQITFVVSTHFYGETLRFSSFK